MEIVDTAVGFIFLIDTKKSLIMLAVTDAITQCLEPLGANDLKRETIYLLLKYVFYYLRMAIAKKIGPHVEGPLFDLIHFRLSIIMGSLAQFEYAFLILLT